MTIPPLLDTALRRLGSAIDRLDAAADRRAAADARRGDLEEELFIMQDDRSRLAVELDGAQARIVELERTTREACRRIDQAESAIQRALDAAGSAED